MKTHKDFMKMALNLAAKGEGFTSPNPMVGAVVVKDNIVIGKGYHEAVGKAHAEVNAIDDAGSAAKGAVLYVTLEPCNHTGRTPPCTEKILGAGIRQVVVAMNDPNPDVTGGGNDYLKSHGVDVISGICEDEAKKLNEVFIKYIRTKRPFVLLKCAMTLDGRIAARTGDSKWVSGEASRKFVHRLRHATDAIMVGIGTVKNDDPSLTTRLDDMKGSDPTRIILDTHLSIPQNAKMLRSDSDADTLIITGDSVSADKRAGIEKNKNVRVVESPLKNGVIDLDLLMDRLGAMGVTSLLIEGGGNVIASAMKAGIIDKINFFYAPKILGGDDGIPVCKGPGPDLMSDSAPVKNINVRRFGDDIMIEGYIDN
ncbi:bifunctional diaminohydroxyphosphoribosylaminopyrimidine deaminase/5-amino-6-(5-phosphoribosylamino)uracil reductase RibD [Desulfonema magnum]|uniref:Riboflavin biosynthesis protein RibD n=1 Tax=Desulfonema magnum TaxID=45655 RepID=A0A975GM76_9BACT|nr:bifunctional diaminohydroxyphosphoribosylaminopyrimidine deaminase/5-amino-6-(5-phosphoribosylamino)uracil reductase RibD [Desulfonema magnum]QTA86399.1 Riboflavin biosynthesis protein [Desulfonema magnum]